MYDPSNGSSDGCTFRQSQVQPSDLFVQIGHEIISTALSLPLIQVGQLSVGCSL